MTEFMVVNWIVAIKPEARSPIRLDLLFMELHHLHHTKNAWWLRDRPIYTYMQPYGVSILSTR
jgi:hypothetical protein